MSNNYKSKREWLEHSHSEPDQIQDGRQQLEAMDELLFMENEKGLLDMHVNRSQTNQEEDKS